MAQFPAFAASVTLAWNPSTDSQAAGYNIYYGGASGVYTNEISAGNATNVTVSGLVPATTYYFAATTYNAIGVESSLSGEVSYTLPPPAPTTNQPPTLNAIGDLSINENAGLQTVSLSGITSGAASENQTLTVAAVSGNTNLIPNPTVNYTSPNTNGTLTFTPVAKAFGSTTVTVTVTDGGTSNNIVTQMFNVTVNPVNQPPTLNSIGNLTTNENPGMLTVNLSGISSGAANESQTLIVAAVSGNTGLIPNPTVNYTSPNTYGTLTFTPVADAVGSAIVTVTVTDGGTSNNIVTRNFTVTLNASNQTPTLDSLSNIVVNAGGPMQKINLTGIGSGMTNLSQRIRVTADTSNGRLISRPMVQYLSPATRGTLTFRPENATGTTTVSVTVNNGAKSNNIITRTFTVIVMPRGASTNLVASVAGATLKAVAASGKGQFAVNVEGISGYPYVVEASTDLVHWMPVATNSAPFIFVDAKAGSFPQRFYRALSAP